MSRKTSSVPAADTAAQEAPTTPARKRRSRVTPSESARVEPPVAESPPVESLVLAKTAKAKAAPARTVKRKPKPTNGDGAVGYDPGRGRLSVAAMDGTVLDLFVEATARAESGHRYLLYSCVQEDLGIDREQALHCFLKERTGQDWDIVDARLLNRRWGELSNSERERLVRREGFSSTRELLS